MKDDSLERACVAVNVNPGISNDYYSLKELIDLVVNGYRDRLVGYRRAAARRQGYDEKKYKDIIESFTKDDTEIVKYSVGAAMLEPLFKSSINYYKAHQDEEDVEEPCCPVCHHYPSQYKETISVGEIL